MTDESHSRISLEQERELVERLKRGDSGALEGLWHAYAEVLYSAVIFPLLPARDRAEEVLQNTFVKAFERIGSFTWQSHGIYPWLKTVARNLAMDMHRKDQRLDRFCKGYGQHVEVIEVEFGAAGRPDRVLVEHERVSGLKARVREVLQSEDLNARYREAIELRLYHEIDREECARRMDVKVGTFDVLFHRALKRFQKLYHDRFGDDE